MGTHTLAPHDDRAVLRNARARAGRIREGVHHYLSTLADVMAAWKERDWETLGYDSWEEYVEGEFGTDRLGLPVEIRQKVVRELRLEGMSQRAIGAAVGVGLGTVQRDLAGDPPGSPGDPHAENADKPLPTQVTGRDGRNYPATRPVSPARPPVDPGPSLPAEPAREPEDRPKPAPWDPAERAEHEKAVRRRQDIEAAHRFAARIVSELRSSVLTIIAGVRYGESGLVTKDMVAELRAAIDMLEREL